MPLLPCTSVMLSQTKWQQTARTAQILCRYNCYSTPFLAAVNFALLALLFLQLHNTNTGLSCVAIASSLGAVVSDNIQGTARQWVEQEVGGVADAVTQFASSQDSILNETCSMVDKYVSDDVKKDVPTGAYAHS